MPLYGTGSVSSSPAHLLCGDCHVQPFLVKQAFLGCISKGSAYPYKIEPLQAAAGHYVRDKACLAPSSSASRALPRLLNSSRSCMRSAPAFSDSASSALTLSHSPASQALSMSRKQSGWQAMPRLVQHCLLTLQSSQDDSRHAQSFTGLRTQAAGLPAARLHNKVSALCTLTPTFQHAVKAM